MSDSWHWEKPPNLLFSPKPSSPLVLLTLLCPSHPFRDVFGCPCPGWDTQEDTQEDTMENSMGTNRKVTEMLPKVTGTLLCPLEKPVPCSGEPFQRCWHYPK